MIIIKHEYSIYFECDEFDLIYMHSAFFLNVVYTTNYTGLLIFSLKYFQSFYIKTKTVKI